jgi:hypothetical protein
MLIFRGLRFKPDAEIGPFGFFVMASKKVRVVGGISFFVSNRLTLLQHPYIAVVQQSSHWNIWEKIYSTDTFHY